MKPAGSLTYAWPTPTPTMPPGLVELMEGLAKDVLKNNPENIYEFCAGHMQKLLEIRDGAPPPKKQLTLEQKIARAQEKIRQKMKNKQFNQDRNKSEQSSENHEHENEQPIKENTIQNLETVIQPVVHGEELVMANEVEIFHEPAVAVATKDISTEEAAQVKHKVEEGIVIATQTLELKKSIEKVNDEEKEDTTCNDIKQTSDIELIVVSENVASENQDAQNKNGVEFISEYIKPTETMSQSPENEKILSDVSESIIDKVELTETVPQHIEIEKIESDASKLIIVKVDNGAENKPVSLLDETMAKEETNLMRNEFNEVVYTQPIQNHSVAVVSHIKDSVQMRNTIKEDKIINDEGLTDIKNEEILIEKVAINIEPAAGSDGITHTIDDKKIEEKLEDLPPETQETTAGEFSNNQPEIVQQIVTPSNETQKEHSTDTKAPDVSNPEAVNDTESLENQAITVKIAEKANVDDSLKTKNNEHLDEHNDHVPENDVDFALDGDKKNIETDDKLLEQERANTAELNVKDNDVTQDHTAKANTNNTMNERKETTENTTVSGMDLETAAITIQKVFRTFLFSKSRASTLDYTVNENSLDEDIEKKDEPEYVLPSTNLNKERRPLGISRMDTVLQTVNEEKSLSLSDDSSFSSAATTIQAHVRGFLVRNRLASNKTASSSSLVNSDAPSTLSLDGDVNEPKKTILNIHIIPERGQFMSRDESLLTSIDLPLDNSPPSSINLHPLGYDKSERRKQLKREDAVQSISPPSNNSGKLSEEVDSVNDAPNESINLKEEHESISINGHDKPQDVDTESCDTTLTISSIAETVIDADAYHNREVLSSPEHNLEPYNRTQATVINSSSDEMDVVTPYPTITEKTGIVDNENDEKPKLVHSGEFHDIVIQTQVKRSESSVVRGE